jgi:hypothetical protein
MLVRCWHGTSVVLLRLPPSIPPPAVPPAPAPARPRTGAVPVWFWCGALAGWSYWCGTSVVCVFGGGLLQWVLKRARVGPPQCGTGMVLVWCCLSSRAPGFRSYPSRGCPGAGCPDWCGTSVVLVWWASRLVVLVWYQCGMGVGGCCNGCADTSAGGPSSVWYRDGTGAVLSLKRRTGFPSCPSRGSAGAGCPDSCGTSVVWVVGELPPGWEWAWCWPSSDAVHGDRIGLQCCTGVVPVR